MQSVNAQQNGDYMYRNEIFHGIQFLSSVQNQDGGIPGMKKTGTSACWTTAEALEAVLLSPYISLSYHTFVSKMVSFLLDTQIITGKNKGAWPEYISTSNAQTLTTGHALAALSLAKDVIDDSTTIKAIRTAINNGFIYLNSVQNHDGGWSIEPDDNNESRALSTLIALRGYIQNGQNCTNSKAVRDACNYLMSLKDAKTGGFSKNVGESPDTCYTARIISILIRAKQYTKNDQIIKRACSFIFQDKSLKSIFSIKHESYVSDNSSGMVIFHSNTPIDVMEALCLCDIYDRRMRKLCEWIVNTQEDNGGWYLGGSRDPCINEGVITWTTNEGIYALSCCNKAFSEKYITVLQKNASLYKKIIILLLIAIISLITHPEFLSENNWAANIWNTIPAPYQNFIQATVLGGAVLNIFSNYIYDIIKRTIKGSDT